MPIAYDIRVATLDDVTELQRLNKELFEFEAEEGFLDDSWNQEWSLSEIGRDYYENCIKAVHYCAWIAHNEDGLAVGYLAGSFYDRAYRTVKLAEIENMYVAKGYRCTGIGTDLADCFKDWAVENGASVAKVETSFQNEHGRSFYQKQGFVPQGVIFEMKTK